MGHRVSCLRSLETRRFVDGMDGDGNGDSSGETVDSPARIASQAAAKGADDMVAGRWEACWAKQELCPCGLRGMKRP